VSLPAHTRSKGIHPHALENFGLQSGYRYRGRNYVKVAYFNADGTQHTKIRIRKAVSGDYKHCWDEDTPGDIIPYGLHKLDMAREAGYGLIGEGESDGWACWYKKIPYLGIPGVDMQKTLKHVDVSMLPPKIYILLEPDQKQKQLDNGQSFYKNIHQGLRKNGYAGEIFCIDFKKATGHKDPSALHIALWKERKDEQFKEIIHQAMEQAIPANDDESESQVDRLLRISRQAIYFRVPSGMLYARVPVNGHWETLSINEMNSGLKRWLTYVFLKETGSIPNKDLLSQSINAIVSIARYEAQLTDVHTRIAEHEGCIYLDLANDKWECVKISSDGWTVIADPPVFFRRTNGLLPLPVPERGGSITELKTLVNLASNEDYYLTVGWLLGTLHPRGPYPGLSFNGGQGTGKSFNTVTIKSITDPNVAPTKSSPKDERDMAIAAQNSHVIGLDNLSSMPIWLSDLLCKLSTGSGFSTRKLHTDDEETIFYACRPFVLNGIEDGLISRPDLLERCILVNLDKIAPAKRRTEHELKQAFKDAHPRILGSLLDATVVALKEIDNTSLGELPRMADFCEWVTAAESALGWEHGTFMNAFVQNQNNASSIAIEASPVARAIKRYMIDCSKWEGKASDLYKTLEKYEDLIQEKNWPGNARALSGQLKRVAPSLYAQGIDVFFHKRTGEGSKITLSMIPNGTNPPDRDQMCVANGVANPECVANGVANPECVANPEHRLDANSDLSGVANSINVAKSADLILSQFIQVEGKNLSTGNTERVENINHADFATPATFATHNPQDPISLETYWALGKQCGYPAIPDLELRAGMVGWNSFSLTHRIRIPDVIARLGGVQ